MELDSELRLTGVSASSFGTSQVSAFKSSLSSTIHDVTIDSITNVVVTDVTSRRRRLLFRGSVDVGYSIGVTVESSSASSASSLFSTITSELTTAVTSGTLATVIANASGFNNVSLDNSTYVEPSNYTVTVVYSPTPQPTPQPTPLPTPVPTNTARPTHPPTPPPSPVPTALPTTPVPSYPPTPAPTAVPTTPLPSPVPSFEPTWQTPPRKLSNFRGNFPYALASDDWFGRSLASLGDLDGDGVVDLVAGASGDDDGGVNAGAVYIILLSDDRVVKSAQKISNVYGAFPYILARGDNFGSSSSSHGDLDGDGVADLVIGAPGDDDKDPDAGAVYILFLTTAGLVKSAQKITGHESMVAMSCSSPEATLAPTALVVALVASWAFGTSPFLYPVLAMSSGAHGADIFTNQPLAAGRRSMATFALINDAFGTSSASLGDLDGDGVADIIVGADGVDDGGGETGAVYVLFLTSDGLVKSGEQISNSYGGLSWYYTLDTSDGFGSSLASMGDLDGDGSADVAVGARGDDDGGTDTGAVFMLFLTSDGLVKSAQKISNSFGSFPGTLNLNDQFGFSCASADLNLDGTRDLVVGATKDDGDAGSAHSMIMDTDGLVLNTEKTRDSYARFWTTLKSTDLFGSSLTSLGDLDGDGVPEVAVGAPGDDDGEAGAGAVYIFSGHPISSPSQLPTTSLPSPPPTSEIPSPLPSSRPTVLLTESPTNIPTMLPTVHPTALPTAMPTPFPTALPTAFSSPVPTLTLQPSTSPPTAIASCSVGQYVAGPGACVACEPGRYAPITALALFDECIVCPEAYFQPRSGQTSCLKCSVEIGPGLTSIPEASNCTLCVEDHAMDDGKCYQCPTGTDCSKKGSRIESLHILPGWWRTSLSWELLECPSQELGCVGGNDTEALCAAGYESYLCAVCSDDFYRYDESCLHCSRDAVGALTWLLTVVLTLGAAGLAWCRRKHVRNGNKVSPYLLFYVFADIDTLAGSLSVQFKILVAFAQMVMALRDVFDLTFPEEFAIVVKHVISWLALGILGDFIGLECFFQATFYDKLVVKTLGPLIFILTLVVVMRRPIREVAITCLDPDLRSSSLLTITLH